MKLKVWIVVDIDNYAGDTTDCWCKVSNYEGLEVFTDRDRAVARSDELDRGYARSSRIEEVEIEI